MINLGEYLRQARQKAGLTQVEVAENLGYTSSQFVSNWERGMSLPPVETLRRVAKLYRISDSELYEMFEKVCVAQFKVSLHKKFKNGRKVSGVSRK